MRLIDADALIEKYGDWYAEEGTEEGYIGTIKGIVNRMPTIEPERKVGKWIDKGWNGDWQYQMDGRGNSWHEWQCSECNHITKGAKWNFCPNCGAKMEEGDHS